MLPLTPAGGEGWGDGGAEKRTIFKKSITNGCGPSSFINPYYGAWRIVSGFRGPTGEDACATGTPVPLGRPRLTPQKFLFPQTELPEDALQDLVSHLLAGDLPQLPDGLLELQAHKFPRQGPGGLW